MVVGPARFGRCDPWDLAATGAIVQGMATAQLFGRTERPRGSRGVRLGGVWLRCVTRWHARSLDRRLAAGADPMESDQLALRVGQLGSQAARARLAGALRVAVGVANQHQPAWPSMRLRTAEVRKNCELLLALAERIYDDEPVGARGLAMTTRLLNDSRSPLFSDRAERPLSLAAFEALIQLDRGPRITSTTRRQRGQMTEMADD
jgi:hypothetical protein